MEHYPDATWIDGGFELLDDGTAIVQCTVEIDGCQRQMFLPVMTGYQNKAKPKPDARDICDSKMRCLVKCLALFGLGHYLFAGEDVAPEPPKSNEPLTMTQLANLTALAEKIPDDQYSAFLEWANVASIKDIKKADFARIKRGLAAKVKALEVSDED